MNRTLSMLLASAMLAFALLTLGGCAMNEADKEFYGRHWMHPSELDEDAPPPSTNGMPNDPSIQY